MHNDPSHKYPYTQTSEEFYSEMYDFGESHEPMPEEDATECPEWIQEQLDEEIPF